MGVGRRVTIVDYGMGNIGSLGAAIAHLGYEPDVSSAAKKISESETIILPGVGSFPAAMSSIKKLDLEAAIRAAVDQGRSRVLGICLGMQLFLTSSDEDGGAPGLGLVEGLVGRFPNDRPLPVPHVGFSTVRAPVDSLLFGGLGANVDFYFVHSFRATEIFGGGLVATAEYGDTFVAGFEIGNVYGTQFHPEKSQTNGLRLLGNFLATDLK